MQLKHIEKARVKSLGAEVVEHAGRKKEVADHAGRKKSVVVEGGRRDFGM